ncbi:TlpA family protein disulfide reductase [bacterium]|nr:TlpA family protein disulfide reductase [bacterium]
MKRILPWMAALALLAVPSMTLAQDEANAAAAAEATAGWSEGETPEIGTQFPQFQGYTYDGNLVSLKDYRGKVVLIDFWATWCAPCRAELPNVRDVYAKYHDKGFDIVAISLDVKEGGKLPEFYANKETALPWPSIYDGKGWDSELANRFGVKAIPATFVLDKDGTIVATDARGAKLWREVGTRVDPGGELPPDLATEIENYMKTDDAAERAKIAKIVEPWVARFQAEINAVVWPLVDEEDIDRDGAAYAFSLMKPTIDEGKDFMALDTAALAGYFAGEFKQAAEIQDNGLNTYLKRAQKSNPDKSMDEIRAALFTQAPDLGARLALYKATIGEVKEARKIMEAVDSAPEKARAGAMKYILMANAALNAAENAKPSEK